MADKNKRDPVTAYRGHVSAFHEMKPRGRRPTSRLGEPTRVTKNVGSDHFAPFPNAKPGSLPAKKLPAKPGGLKVSKY